MNGEFESVARDLEGAGFPPDGFGLVEFPEAGAFACVGEEFAEQGCVCGVDDDHGLESALAVLPHAGHEMLGACLDAFELAPSCDEEALRCALVRRQLAASLAVLLRRPDRLPLRRCAAAEPLILGQ